MRGAAAPLNAGHRYIGTKTGTWTATGGHGQRQKDGKWKWTEEQKEEYRTGTGTRSGRGVYTEGDGQENRWRKNILGTWKGTGEQEQRGRNRRSVTQTGINREIGTGTVTGIEGHQ